MSVIKKNTRGGFRPGSGRKKRDTEALSLRVPSSIIRKLNEKYSVRDRNRRIILMIELLTKLD